MPRFHDIPIKVRLTIYHKLILPKQPCNAESYHISAKPPTPP